MNKRIKKSTNAEKNYIRDMEENSAFERLERGEGELLAPPDYPEPLRRFLRREAITVHVRLTAPLRKKLNERSRRAGVSPDELARRLIKEALNREAV